MKKSMYGAAIFCIILLLAGAAHADYVTPEYYGGTLAWSGGGIVAADAWASATTKITWHVTDNGNGTWTYNYTWTAPNKQLSHILIEVTPGSSAEDFWGFSQSSGTWMAPDYYGNEGGSSPGIPGTLYSLKLTETSGQSVTFGFTSTHAPVWGDFYAKDGKDGGAFVYAYNAGFLAVGDTDTNDGRHIVVPDGQGTKVPEPGTMVLLGMGLLGLGLAVRKRS